MYKPPHLAHLSRDIGWYVNEHRERQQNLGNSHASPPAYTLDELLRRNRKREYKGVHEFCAADELGEVVTCVIFKTPSQNVTSKQRPAQYYHTLYLGLGTQDPEYIHRQILAALNISPEEYQASLIAKH